MADLRSMLEKAKKDAEDAKTNVKNLDKVEQNITDMDKKAVKAITLYVEQYPNTLTNAMDANAKKIDDYTARIQDTSIRLQKQVDNAKSTLALLTGSKDKGYIDITSAKLMLDYAEEYKIAYIVVIHYLDLYLLTPQPVFDFCCILFRRYPMVLVEFSPQFFQRQQHRGWYRKR